MINKEIKFKITLKQQFLVLIWFFVMNSVLLIAYFKIINPLFVDGLIIGGIVFLIALFVLPVIILHPQYVIKNCLGPLVISTEEHFVSIGKGKDLFKFNFSDIKELRYYATLSHLSSKGGSSWYTFDSYRFYKIILNNSDEIIVTCLMINNIENTLEELLGIKAIRKFRAIPFIY